MPMATDGGGFFHSGPLDYDPRYIYTHEPIH